MTTGKKQIILQLGDCMDLMKDIPDGSIDLILCDMPYGVTDFDWDKIIDGKSLFAEYKRICKRNSNVLLFCQMHFANYLMNSAILSEFSHCLIWEKDNKTRFLSAKKLPMSQYEMILCFRLNKYANTREHKSLREYFSTELSESKWTIKDLEKAIPNYSAHHWFSFSSDFRIPTRENYKRLQELTGRFLKPYDDVRMEFQREKINKCTYNGNNESDILRFAMTDPRVHPTQKPVALLEYLIRTYSNPGDTVLDNCMGSGSTGVACVNTGRNFIGMECNEYFFEIAKERIRCAQGSLFLEDES